MKRWILRALGFLVLLALAAGLWVAIEFQWTRGSTPPIDGDGAIASLEQVTLGGVPQWVLIRGHRADAPVVLWLHGGPGMPSMYLAHAFQRSMERDFVMVHWDRSGAGKSFGALGSGPLGVRQRIDDTHELTRWLQERFGVERILLVGHSWGSYLGLHAVRERPEDYLGFVGTGVIAGTREEADAVRREWAVAQARAAGDDEAAERFAAGTGPSEDDVFRYGGGLRGATSFWPLLRIGLRAPEYTLTDALNVRKGVQLVHERMAYDVEPAPLAGELPEVAVPVAFLLGRHDYTTPSKLAADYLGRLHAPAKRVVWFEESAHFPFLSEPERFHRELLAIVDGGGP